MNFRIRNHAGAKPAPEFDTDDPNKYFGYFMNEDGEQAIFVYDRETLTATLYMGDCDWDPLPLIDGLPQGIILNEAEAHWLHACWTAAKRWHWEVWLKK